MNLLTKIKQKIFKAQNIIRAKGFRGVKSEINHLRYKFREQRSYQKWLKLNKLTDEKRAEIRAKILSFPHKPLISVASARTRACSAAR